MYVQPRKTSMFFKSVTNIRTMLTVEIGFSSISTVIFFAVQSLG